MVLLELIVKQDVHGQMLIPKSLMQKLQEQPPAAHVKPILLVLHANLIVLMLSIKKALQMEHNVIVLLVNGD